MQKFLHILKARWLTALIVIIVIIGIGVVLTNRQPESASWVTAQVDEGTVSQIISVSGTMDATKTAELSFPVVGTLTSVNVTEGMAITRSTILATLSHSDLTAEYRDAEAALLIAEANRSELVTGLTPEERDVSKTKVQIAEENLARVKKEQDELVLNAYRTLLSSDLEARPTNRNIDDIPPFITGTYRCAEGTYIIEMFNSGAKSGYSYRLSGLESGTFTAYTESPAPLGTCGLLIQFVSGESYGNSTWNIVIPNVEGASYLANLNAYNLAKTSRDNAIRAAEQNLELAKQTETLDTATPRSEALTRAEASVLQAKARLEKIAAQIQDNILTAPFDGVVTHVGLVVGETVGTAPVITMISDDVFELTALIPEIDITKISLGQGAEVTFDARPGETLPASITFVSPLAREIGGVSYFEAKLMLDEPQPWLRSGLNADVDIIIDRKEGVLRIPKRFLIEKDGTYSVLVPDGEVTRSVSVDVELKGSDGFVAIDGLNRDDTVIAP